MRFKKFTRRHSFTHNQNKAQCATNCTDVAGMSKWENTIRCLLGISIEEWTEMKGKRGRKPYYFIELTSEEYKKLEQIIRSGKSSKKIDIRARIILMAAGNLSNTAIADNLGIARDTVIHWRKQFVMHRLKGLHDAPRSGRPRSIHPFIEMTLIMLIIQNKAENWVKRRYKLDTLRKSALDLHQQLKVIFGSLTPCLSSVYSMLKRNKLRPWLYRSWVHIRDPNFFEKAAVVLDLYHGFFNGVKLGIDEYILSADEMTQIQVLERMVTPTHCGRKTRVDYEYKRHGTISLHAAINVLTGKVYYRFPKASNKKEFRELVRRIMKQEPFASAKRVFWVVDNGPCHHPSTFDAWLTKEFDGRAVAVHTPVHASWLNQIEIFFSILSRKALTPRDFKTYLSMMHVISSFIDERNVSAKPFKWKYTKEKLAELLEHLKSDGMYPPQRKPLDVPGIGKKRRALLLSSFETVDKLKTASVEQIISLPGFGPALAVKVWEQLH